MEAFKKVKSLVDLTPICTLDEENKISAESDNAVQDRVKFITDDLNNVQSWLNPFRGTHMNEKDEITKMEKGEPEGLRHVAGVYLHTKFYTEYLKEWKLGRG